jgi:hypothetical protein
MLKKSDKFSSLFRSKQNLNDVAEKTTSCNEVRVTQCYSVTTGKVSTLIRSPSFSTVSTHSSISFDGDGDDESETFPAKAPTSGLKTNSLRKFQLIIQRGFLTLFKISVF